MESIFVDSTPVLDIKPYVHQYDCALDSQSGWVDNLPTNTLEIQWSQEAEMKCNEFCIPPTIKKTVEECLRFDTRQLER